MQRVAGVAITAPHSACPPGVAVRTCDFAAPAAAIALRDKLIQNGVTPPTLTTPRDDDFLNPPWRPSDDANRWRPGVTYGESGIDAAIALAHKARAGLLLLDVHSYPDDTPRAVCGGHPLDARQLCEGSESWCAYISNWNAYVLMVGVDCANEASLRAGTALAAYLRAHGAQKCELWIVHPTVNKLIAYARERAAAAPAYTLLLEFRESAPPTVVEYYARTVADWVATVAAGNSARTEAVWVL